MFVCNFGQNWQEGCFCLPGSRCRGEHKIIRCSENCIDGANLDLT
jgi:hypothetical protein